jgi:thiol-disulfide isomerase/thioredoxin
MDDPRMGRLCAPLAYRPEQWSNAILNEVAVKHPDRAVRGQAAYSLGMWWRFAADGTSLGRNRTDRQSQVCLTSAKEWFTRVVEDYAGVVSTDGNFRLADMAKAELTRITNLPNLKVGKVAPEITGVDLDGSPLKLSTYRGNVVVICFWATWCGPCMAMVPHERELVQRMKGKPFVLLGVNSDESADREKAKQTVRDKQMTWPSWWDNGVRGAIQTEYNIDHWPTVYVLDANGVIRYFDVRKTELDKAVDALLAELESTRTVEDGK